MCIHNIFLKLLFKVFISKSKIKVIRIQKLIKNTEKNNIVLALNLYIAYVL